MSSQRKPSRQASVDDRIEVVFKGELSLAEAARRHGVSSATVGNWHDRFVDAGKAGMRLCPRWSPTLDFNICSTTRLGSGDERIEPAFAPIWEGIAAVTEQVFDAAHTRCLGAQRYGVLVAEPRAGLEVVR